MSSSSARLVITRRTIVFLVGMTLTNFAISMGLVLTPLYLRELGATISQVGLFFTISMIFPILVRLLGGWLADVVGRLQMILVGSVTGVLTFAVYAAAPSWEFALLAPALMAITSSLTIPAYKAYIADITPEGSRGRMFGVSQSVYSGSFVIAPPIGGLLVATMGFRFMFGVSSVVFAVAALIFFLLLRSGSSAAISDQGVSLSSLRSSVAQLWTLFLAGGVVAWIVIIDGVRDIAMKLSYDLIPVYLGETQGVSVEQIGLMDGIFGLTLLLTLYPAGLLVDRTSEQAVLALGFVAAAGSRLVLPLATDLAGFTLSFMLQALGFALLTTAFASLISKVVPQHLLGVFYGIFATSLSIFSLPSPWLGSQIWELFDPRYPFLISFAIGIVLVLPAYFLLRLPPSRKRDLATSAVPHSDNASVLYARLRAGQEASFVSESSEIISQHGGVLNHSSDSSLNATFGISPQRTPPQVSALLATHAALSLLEYVDSVNRARADSGLAPFELGIGVDTGEMTVGPSIAGGRLDQGLKVGGSVRLVADLLQTASLLQARAEGGGLWISERTYEYLTPAHDQFQFGPNGLVREPGAQDGVQAYQVLGRLQSLNPNATSDSSAAAATR